MSRLAFCGPWHLWGCLASMLFAASSRAVDAECLESLAARIYIISMTYNHKFEAGEREPAATPPYRADTVDAFLLFAF